MAHGEVGRPIASVTMVCPLPRATAADSTKVNGHGIGTGVRRASDFNGSAGYWVTGVTMTRKKSTSPGRSAAASATRSPIVCTQQDRRLHVLWHRILDDPGRVAATNGRLDPVSYTHLRAHETPEHL